MRNPKTYSKKGQRFNKHEFLQAHLPISLLNTDYNIITHILASRLQKVLPEIISTDQNGYLQGRFIGHNIRPIRDTMQHIILKKQRAYLLILDF